MDGGQLRGAFEQTVLRAFGLDHREYLSQRNKSFWGLEIEARTRAYVPLFGNPPEQVVGLPFLDAKAGYRVDVPDLPEGTAGDVLLIATDLLGDQADDELRAGLLLHEACHFVIDADLPRLDVSASDQVLVDTFRGRVDPDDPLHTQEFLRQLAAAARAVSGEEGAVDLMECAMKFNAMPTDDWAEEEDLDAEV